MKEERENEGELANPPTNGRNTGSIIIQGSAALCFIVVSDCCYVAFNSSTAIEQ
jgi:hypothetical protein